jgi:hypothetical protein
MDTFLALNPGVAPRIIVVDNFYKDPHAVREFGLKQEFFDDPGYIGLRTRSRHFIPGTRERFEELIGEKIKGWDADNDGWEWYGMNGRFQYNVSGQPLVYHCDGQKWAAMVYLTPDAPFEAGTTMYAHKATRLRHNSEEGIMQAFNQRTFLDPTPYEKVDVIGNVFNRLVIFSGGLIHGASCYFGDNKENGRFWHMFFFD